MSAYYCNFGSHPIRHNNGYRMRFFNLFIIIKENVIFMSKNTIKNNEKQQTKNKTKIKKKTIAIGYDVDTVEKYTKEAKEKDIPRAQLIRQKIRMADIMELSAPELSQVLTKQANAFNRIKDKISEDEYRSLMEPVTELNNILGGKNL